MTGRLAGKVAIVTGGASGFGGGIASCLAAEGAKVLVADRDRERGAEMVARIAADGGTAAFQAVDVTRQAEVAAMVNTAVETFGGLDIMVANAGVGQRPTRLEDTTDADYDVQFDVNMRGVFYCCKEVLPHFRRQKSGNIIITASGIALTPRPNLVIYGATKGAVLTFAKGLAMELAPEGLRVNALCPAAGDTPMLAEFMGGEETDEGRARFTAGLPMGKLITPHDMGMAAVFLASDEEAGTLTGCALPVDSGRCI